MLTLIFFSDAILGLIVATTINLLVSILIKSDNELPLIPLTGLFYTLNYWISPYITYGLPMELLQYPMKISKVEYFNIMIPGLLAFIFGLNIFNKRFLFIRDHSLDKIIFHHRFLIHLVLVSSAVGFLRLTLGLGFIFYLIEQLSHVGALLLILSYPSKFMFFKILPMTIKLVVSFNTGFYHDLLIWMIFYCFWFAVVYKPSAVVKISYFLILTVFILFIQSIKFSLRDINSEIANTSRLDNVIVVSTRAVDQNELFSYSNFLATLNRANQGWILASTVDNMDRANNFQGVNHFIKYIESAALPRFLSPNKINSGDKMIFNEFSGHTLNNSTSMGLGVFADGYVAGGVNGLILAGLLFGILISVLANLFLNWMRFSRCFIVLLFPFFSYAIRPDAEFHTVLNHIVKVTLFMFLLVQLVKSNRKYFSKLDFKVLTQNLV